LDEGEVEFLRRSCALLAKTKTPPARDACVDGRWQSDASIRFEHFVGWVDTAVVGAELPIELLSVETQVQLILLKERLKERLKEEKLGS